MCDRNPWVYLSCRLYLNPSHDLNRVRDCDVQTDEPHTCRYIDGIVSAATAISPKIVFVLRELRLRRFSLSVAYTEWCRWRYGFKTGGQSGKSRRIWAMLRPLNTAHAQNIGAVPIIDDERQSTTLHIITAQRQSLTLHLRPCRRRCVTLWPWLCIPAVRHQQPFSSRASMSAARQSRLSRPMTSRSAFPHPMPFHHPLRPWRHFAHPPYFQYPDAMTSLHNDRGKPRRMRRLISWQTNRQKVTMTVTSYHHYRHRK